MSKAHPAIPAIQGNIIRFPKKSKQECENLEGICYSIASAMMHYGYRAAEDRVISKGRIMEMLAEQYRLLAGKEVVSRSCTICNVAGKGGAHG